MSRVGYVSEVFRSFQGEGAYVGDRQLFVRLAGCNIRCRYCDTPDSLQRTPRCRIDRAGGPDDWIENPLAATRLRGVIDEELAVDSTVAGISVTGGEPLVQAPFLAEVLGGERLPVPVLLETSGILTRQLERVIEWVDVVSMDMKPPSNTGERAFWKEHEAFLAVAVQREVYVKVLVDAGTEEAEVARAARIVGRVAPAAPMFLQPVTSEAGGVDLGREALERFFRVAREHVGRVRVVPQTHKMLRIQ